MSHQEVKFEGALEIKMVIAYLEDLIASLKNGKVCVQDEGHFVTLSPAEVVNMEIEAEQKKDGASLSIELSWHQKPDPASAKVSLKISNQEPKVIKEDKDSEKEEKKDKADKKDKREKKEKKEKKDKGDKKDKKNKKDKEDEKKDKKDKAGKKESRESAEKEHKSDSQQEFGFRRPAKKKLVL